MSQKKQLRYTLRREGDTLFVRMTGSPDFLHLVEKNLDHYARKVVEELEEEPKGWFAHAGSTSWESPTVLSFRITKRLRLPLGEISDLFSNK